MGDYIEDEQIKHIKAVIRELVHKYKVTCQSIADELGVCTGHTVRNWRDGKHGTSNANVLLLSAMLERYRSNGR